MVDPAKNELYRMLQLVLLFTFFKINLSETVLVNWLCPKLEIVYKRY